jgi:hypothetical protein
MLVQLLHGILKRTFERLSNQWRYYCQLIKYLEFVTGFDDAVGHDLVAMYNKKVVEEVAGGT